MVVGLDAVGIGADYGFNLRTIPATARQGRPSCRLGGSKIGSRTFIYRYVFPDGELLDVGDTVLAMQAAWLEVRDVVSLREHYASTLRCWVPTLISIGAKRSLWSVLGVPRCGGCTWPPPRSDSKTRPASPYTRLSASSQRPMDPVACRRPGTTGLSQVVPRKRRRYRLNGEPAARESHDSGTTISRWARRGRGDASWARYGGCFYARDCRSGATRSAPVYDWVT